MLLANSISSLAEILKETPPLPRVLRHAKGYELINLGKSIKSIP